MSVRGEHVVVQVTAGTRAEAERINAWSAACHFRNRTEVQSSKRSTINRDGGRVDRGR